MNRNEIVKHIASKKELHLHQQQAGPMNYTRWVLTTYTQTAKCETDHCIRIPLELGKR